MIMRYHLLVASVIVAASSSADGGQFGSSLRSTLMNANPTISIHKRSVIEREASSGLFEPTIRAIKFWRYVGPIVVNYKCTEYWYKIAYKNDPVSRIQDAYHVHKF